MAALRKITNAADVAEVLKGITKMDEFTALVRAVDNSPNFARGSMDNMFNDFLTNSKDLPGIQLDAVRGLQASVPRAPSQPSPSASKLPSANQQAQINTAQKGHIDIENGGDVPDEITLKFNKWEEDFNIKKNLLDGKDLTFENTEVLKLDLYDPSTKTFIGSKDYPFENAYLRKMFGGGKTGQVAFLMRQNPRLTKLTFLGVFGGITVGTIMAIKAKEAEEINKKEYIIKEIKKDEKTKKTIITFDSDDYIVPGDSLFIQQSNSVPDIDGTRQPKKFNKNGMTEIDDEIETSGTYGVMKIQTSAANRTNDTFNQIGETIAAVPAGLGGGILNEIFGALGLGGDVGMYISIGLLVCCLLSSILASVILVMRYGD